MIDRTISHYKIVEKLGAGGMGVVYRAEDTKLGRSVALKFLPPEAAATEEARARFIQEARTSAALRHPNICPVYEIDESDGQTFIAMAFIPGQTLRQKVSEGPVSLSDAVYVAVQVARGLEEAHDKGIIHRDIKGANIMIGDEGEATIMDFGLAKLAGSGSVTKTGSTMGTAAYMSPEQARGEDVDQRTDIWSLGVCLYEMVTGELPFVADHEQAVLYSVINVDPKPVHEWRPDVPDHIEKIIQKMLQKNREDRFENAAELRRELQSRGIEDALDDTGTRSIAVLPFTNMSADKDQEYFCDGIAEDITNDLTRVENLRVAARTSAFAYKGRQEDIRAIGRELGVETILEGSVRKAGDRLRITTQLINITDGYHLWSERYDRELKDVFEIQDEIASAIVAALRVQLSDNEKEAMAKAKTRDAEAYDLYLRGRHYFYILYGKSLEFALDMFAKAIETDPAYALAYAGLADASSFHFMYLTGGEKALETALDASKKALELDPQLAEAHAARGLAVSLRHNYDEAEREFEDAIRLNPNLFEAYYFYARTCHSQGKHVEAADLFDKAGRANPEDFQAPLLRTQCLHRLGRKDEAAADFERGLKLAKRRLEQHPEDVRARGLGANAMAELGRLDEGIAWVEAAISAAPNDTALHYNVACFYARQGFPDKALQFLGSAVDGGYAHRHWIENDPDWDELRSDPRFQPIIDRIRE